MCGDCILECFRGVSYAVSNCAKAQNIPPGVYRRQSGDMGLRRLRQRSQRSGFIDIADGRDRANIVEVESMGERLHCIRYSWAGNLLSALAIRDKHRHLTASDVFHIDFGPGIFLITYHYSRTTNVFHARIFHPELIRVFRIDGNCRWNIFELWTNQSQSRFVFPNGGLPLAFKGGINHGELPSRRSLPRPNALLPTIEMYFLRHISTIINARKPGADVEVHVRQKAMLGIMGANSHRTWIPILNFDIDVAHR